jgi:hypothetical protein
MKASLNSTNSKRQVAGQLMSETGSNQNKAELLSIYGVERIRDLQDTDLDDLIFRLRTIKNEKQKEDTPRTLRQARSLVLGLLDDMGIKGKNGNWKPVNEFLLKPQISGKVLYEMNVEELKECAKRIRAVIHKGTKNKEEDDLLAKSN